MPQSRGGRSSTTWAFSGQARDGPVMGYLKSYISGRTPDVPKVETEGVIELTISGIDNDFARVRRGSVFEPRATLTIVTLTRLIAVQYLVGPIILPSRYTETFRSGLLWLNLLEYTNHNYLWILGCRKSQP